VLIHFAYQLKEDPSQTIVVATTRIETMLGNNIKLEILVILFLFLLFSGDVAVAVNSKDPRY